MLPLVKTRDAIHLGPKWPLLVKNGTLFTGIPIDLLWLKKCAVIHRGPNWPFSCLDGMKMSISMGKNIVHWFCHFKTWWIAADLKMIPLVQGDEALLWTFYLLSCGSGGLVFPFATESEKNVKFFCFFFKSLAIIYSESNCSLLGLQQSDSASHSSAIVFSQPE